MDDYIARTEHVSFAHRPAHCSQPAPLVFSLGVQLGTDSGHCLGSAMAAAGAWEVPAGGNPVYTPVPAVPKQPPIEVAEKSETEVLLARLSVLRENKAARDAKAAALEAGIASNAAAAKAKAATAGVERQRLDGHPKATVKNPPGHSPPVRPPAKQPPPGPCPAAAKATQPTAFYNLCRHLSMCRPCVDLVQCSPCVNLFSQPRRPVAVDGGPGSRRQWTMLLPVPTQRPPTPFSGH